LTLAIPKDNSNFCRICQNLVKNYTCSTGVLKIYQKPGFCQFFVSYPQLKAYFHKQKLPGFGSFLMFFIRYFEFAGAGCFQLLDVFPL
jgi:hypothetical protein